MTQPEFHFPSPAEQDQLRDLLLIEGWQTRRQVCAALGWSERKVRDVAESLGAEVVRGQAGFKLTDQLDLRTDISIALQARDAAISQGKKMIRYGFALGRRLHARIG